MTICTKMYEGVEKRLLEKKSLEEIGNELCEGVKDPRGKVVRIVKELKGANYLTENAEWLQYNAEKNNNPKGRPVKEVTDWDEKQDTEPQCECRLEIFNQNSEEKTILEEPESIEQQKGIIEPPKPIQIDWEVCPGCGYAYDKVSGIWLSPAEVEAFGKKSTEGE